MGTPEATEHQGLEDRLAGRIDGVLHLMDRQLIDSEGEFLGKVDDVELSVLRPDREPGSAGHQDVVVISGLLTGAAALLGRLGGRLGRVLVGRWVQMRVSEPDRARPWRIDMDDVARLDSALHLSRRREGVLRRDREEHRLSQLTGMDAEDSAGTRVGRVLDARFEASAAHEGRLVLRSLIVGHARPGSMLGYDRRADQGPVAIRAVVRWLHRDTVIVEAEDAVIDWPAGVVRLRTRPTERPDHPFR